MRRNFITPASASQIAPRANLWCERGDSNPHGFTRQILSLVRLPIPPLSQCSDYTKRGHKSLRTGRHRITQNRRGYTPFRVVAAYGLMGGAPRACYCTAFNP